MNAKKTERAVNYCGVELRYTLEYKKVKNINLRVRPNGEVCVSAPPAVSPDRVDAFVAAKGGFIIGTRKKLEARTPPAPKKFEDGEVFPILGRQLRLAVIRSDDERVQSDEGHLYLYVRDPGDIARKQRLYGDWTARRCEKVFGETADAVYERLRSCGVPHARITVKDMKSRWGSCMPAAGQITLNKQLLKADPECIEYVIVHEYAHFLHPDHSPAFHAFVGSVLPDWKERNARLRGVEIVKGQ